MTEELTVWADESEWVDRVHLGNCLQILRRLPDNSVDAIVCDPPYGLGTREPSVEEIIAYLQGASLDTGGDFMGHDWKVPSVGIWKECFRVLKPGGQILGFAGTRTFDLISIGLRAAGFENRDCISEFYPVRSWIHSQGFPKGGNIGKLIDRQAGATRKIVGPDPEAGRRNKKTPRFNGNDYANGEVWQGAEEVPLTEPATEEAKKWDQWFTNLKPAWEPILCFRKPIEENTVVKQVLKTGTGALNIGATRVAADMSEFFSATGKPRSGMGHAHGYGMGEGFGGENANPPHPAGRFPANMILVHGEGCRRVGTKQVSGANFIGHSPASYPTTKNIYGSHHKWGYGEKPPTSYVDDKGKETVDSWECEPGCPVPMVDAQSGERPSTLTGRADPNARHDNPGDNGGASWFGGGNSAVYADSGGASRFYAQFEQDVVEPPFFYCAKASRKETTLGGKIENLHPTKKPLKLMQYLVKLVTPKGAIVLDPYCGSGTTCVAAVIEGMHYVGIELDPEWIPVIEARVAYEQSKKIEVLKAEEDKQRTAAEMLSLLEEEEPSE